MEIDERYTWSQKSKKYRTKYLDELGKLYTLATEQTLNPKEGVKYDHSETKES